MVQLLLNFKLFINKSVFLKSFVIAVIFLLPALVNGNLLKSVDSTVHLYRIFNISESLKNYTFFAAWFDFPYMGYPQDFHYAIPYYLCSFIGLFCKLSIAYNVTFILGTTLLINNCYNFFKVFTNNKAVLFFLVLISCLNLQIQSLIYGAGSITRLFGYAFVFPTLLHLIQFYRRENDKHLISFFVFYILCFLSHPMIAFFVLLVVVSISIRRLQYVFESLKRNKTNFAVFILFFSSFIFDYYNKIKFLDWYYVYDFFSPNDPTFNLKSIFFFWGDIDSQLRSFYIGIALFIFLSSSILHNIFQKKSNRLLLDLSLFLFLCYFLILIQNSLDFVSYFLYFVVIPIGLYISIPMLKRIKKKAFIIIIFFLFIDHIPHFYNRLFIRSIVQIRPYTNLKINPKKIKSRIIYDESNQRLLHKYEFSTQLEELNFFPKNHGVAEYTPKGFAKFLLEKHRLNNYTLQKLMAYPLINTHATKQNGVTTLNEPFHYRKLAFYEQKKMDIERSEYGFISLKMKNVDLNKVRINYKFSLAENCLFLISSLSFLYMLMIFRIRRKK